MDCIFDLNFDILNLINDAVIKKRKLMKYLDEKEKKTKYQSYFVFRHINMLKEIFDDCDENIIDVLEKDEDGEYQSNLLDDEYCREALDEIYLDRYYENLQELKFNKYYGLD
tara:strand:+ start:147 stop:482 length:336 start_codon:yes stop_codon:yes gene_type:complete